MNWYKTANEESKEVILDRYGYSIPRYWYHNTRSRAGDESGIPAYDHEAFNGKKGVYLSSTPLGNSYKIDASRLDIKLLRPSFQSEGYYIYYGDIPSEAIIS